MLIFDLTSIGDKIYGFRRQAGLTQAEVAERAGLSERAYADIERGTVNARIISIQKICDVLNATPNDILTEKETDNISLEQVWKALSETSDGDKHTAAAILEAFLRCRRSNR